MKTQPIFIPYNVFNPKNCKYQVNMKNDVVRNLLANFKRENRIPYYCPLDDSQRLFFERVIVASDIKDNDNMVVALEKFKKAEASIKKGYTSDDVQQLKRKILNKEVV